MTTHDYNTNLLINYNLLTYYLTTAIIIYASQRILF